MKFLLPLLCSLSLIYAGPVTYFTGAKDAGYNAGNQMSNFRVAEGTTATFGCPGGQTLRAIASFYGSPSNDPGYQLVQSLSSKGLARNCRIVWNGQGLNYIKSQCNGKQYCSPAINNQNMGGDPCPGTYKFMAVAIGCGAGYSAQSDEPNIDNPEAILLRPGGDDYNVQLPSTMLYMIGTIILALLAINIACLSYSNCCKSKPKARYGKVAQFASSDEEMQNLQN